MGHISALLSAFGFALTNYLHKKISNFDSILCVLFWMTLMHSIFALVISLFWGIPIHESKTIMWIIIVGLSGLSARYCPSRALQCGVKIMIAPMEFIRLPAIVLVGTIVCSEPLTLSFFFGSMFVIFGNLLNIYGKKSNSYK